MILKHRNRQVSFRVSQDEYERLSEFCVTTGARSLSDVARCALFEMTALSDGEASHAIARRVQTLDTRIRQLNRRVEQLADLMKSEPREAKGPSLERQERNRLETVPGGVR